MDFSVSSDIVAELLEVAINNILYTREIYPPAVFQRRRKYNIPVQMCIHPALSSYISDCIASIKPILEKGEVEKVVVSILSSEGKPVENFVFEIVQHATRPQDIKKDPQLVKLEESLRAFCLKMSISDSLLQPLPCGCTFAIQLHVPERTQRAMTLDEDNQNFPWVEAEKEQTEVKNPHIVPLKSLCTSMCKMQLYVEESEEKS
ncbi:DNA polymerase zeta subunit 2 [Oratosquilla oratoria]|uniref:DNA polymerase zeta subunit 2 n=1 Tax=Oratosquilla oratoria TaxID=337810 RepID=UPI003F76EAEF